jgi:hypothetical protein
MCTESAGTLYEYFGDDAVERDPTWVVVWLCFKHAGIRIGYISPKAVEPIGGDEEAAAEMRHGA